MLRYVHGTRSVNFRKAPAQTESSHFSTEILGYEARFVPDSVLVYWKMAAKIIFVVVAVVFCFVFLWVIF